MKDEKPERDYRHNESGSVWRLFSRRAKRSIFGSLVSRRVNVFPTPAKNRVHLF